MRPRQTAQFWAYLLLFTSLIGLLALVSAIATPAEGENSVVVSARSAPKPQVENEVGKQQRLQAGIRREARLADAKEVLFVAKILYRLDYDYGQVRAEDARRAANAANRASKARSVAPVTNARTVTGLTGDAAWDCIHNGESKNWAANTGNGFYGGLQFDYGTWQGVPSDVRQGYERADLAPPEVQLAAGRWVQERRGWGPWPTVARRCGLL